MHLVLRNLEVSPRPANVHKQMKTTNPTQTLTISDSSNQLHTYTYNIGLQYRVKLKDSLSWLRPLPSPEQSLIPREGTRQVSREPEAKVMPGPREASYCRLKKYNGRPSVAMPRQTLIRLRHSQVPGRAERMGCRAQEAPAVRRL